VSGLAVKETSLYVKDLKRCARFFRRALGLEPISYAEGRHVFFRAGKGVLLCFKAEATRKDKVLPPHGAIGSVHAAFEAPKGRYAQVRRQVGRQTKIIKDHVWSPKSRCFYFRDPDGNLLEVLEPGFWEAFKPLKGKQDPSR
jgi:catechol-2,3-dioxygenase